MTERNSKPEYIIRRCEDKDHQPLNEAYNKFTGRSRTFEQYLWQWVDTPFETSESWVIEWTPAHEIVGHHGVMFLPFSEKGQSIPVGKTENTFVHADHSKKVFYLAMEKKALGAMNDRFAYIYTNWPDGGKGAIGLIRKRLGYVSVGKTADYVQNINYRASRSLIKEKFPQFSRIATLLALGHALVQGALQIVNRIRSRKLKVIPLSWDRVGEVEEFWRINQQHYGITPDRTSSYLKWRFADNPYAAYELIRLGTDQSLLGYAVIRHKKKRIGNCDYPIAFIEDLIVLKGDETNFYLALAALSRYFSSSIMTITLLVQDDALNSAIYRFLGIIKKWHEIRGPELLVRQRNESSSRWYYTSMMGEGIELGD